MSKPQETAELRHIGDALQSAASRMAEWIRNLPDGSVRIPYEVHMAAIEAEDYVDQWTAARVGYATARPAESSLHPTPTKRTMEPSTNRGRDAVNVRPPVQKES